MIAGSGPQLLVVGGAILASSSPSAVSWLYFADRLIELPLGIVGVAMGTVLMPNWAARCAATTASPCTCRNRAGSSSPWVWRCRRRWD